MSIMTGFEQFRFRTTLIFLTFPGWGGGSGKIEIKASLIPTELELGLSLAKLLLLEYALINARTI